LLLEDGRADPADYDNSAIRSASLRGRTEVVRLLLEDGRADPAVNDNRPIKSASVNGHTEIVKMLLEDPRVNPTAENHYALGVASEENEEDIVELLIQYYAQNNVNVEEFFNLLSVNHRKYILMYYDVNDIPEDTIDFGLDENNTEDRLFIDYLLTRYGSNYDVEKRAKLLRLIEFNPDTVSEISSVLSQSIPANLLPIIGRFLI
jgi:ankyrin repeat protein